MRVKDGKEKYCTEVNASDNDLEALMTREKDEKERNNDERCILRHKSDWMRG